MRKRPQRTLSVSRLDNTMQAVLVQELTSNDVTVWDARDWTSQRVVVTGVTREQAIENFVSLWNFRNQANLSQEDFRIFGPIMTSTELSESANGWTATTYADRMYATGPHETLAACKTAFVSLWNSEYSDAIENPVTEDNVDWVNHP